MDQQLFTAVDAYIDDLFDLTDEALDFALKSSRDRGLPAIQISPSQGRFLQILARLTGARRILEIGTLGGYSTIWLARALPTGGKLVTLEYDPKHAEVARAALVRAGLADRTQVLTGAALDTLPGLASQDTFDLVFIDADKHNYPGYLDWSLRLTRPGGLILADNVVREGKVLDESSADPSVQGVRRFNELLARDPRVEAVVLQQIGVKGYDGLAIARVRDAAHT